MIRDMDDKELGQNKVLCSSSRVKLPRSTTMQAPRQRFPRQGDRSLATRRLLALEPHWFRFLFLASSLTLLLYRLFLVASFLSPHLACFLAHFAGRPRFRFRGLVDLTVGLAIGGAISIRSKVALEEGRTTDWSVKNLLTQRELRRKTKVKKIL